MKVTGEIKPRSEKKNKNKNIQFGNIFLNENTNYVHESYCFNSSYASQVHTLSR